jgi:two-component system response regulator MprA
VPGDRVLVVDDDASVRRMLERSLRAEGFAVEAVADGGTALVAAERSPAAVIVLDVGLPGLDGLAVCHRLRDKGVDTPILMLTARDAVADRVEGLQAGADDYLVKPFATEELVARLNVLTRRGNPHGGALAAGGLALRRDALLAVRDGTEIELTEREAALLELLMRNARQVVTRSRAVDEVWNGAATENVVDRYVKRLRDKLGQPSAIRTVRGSGFIIEL